MTRWILAAGAVVVAVGMDGRAEYPTLKARPKPLAGIPNYPYEPVNPPAKPTVTGTGQSRLTLGGDGELLSPATVLGGPVTTTRETQTCRTVSMLRRTERTETRERVTTTGATGFPAAVPAELATFTLKDRALTADHCRVSGVSVALSPDGHYAIRYRAELLPDRAAGVGPRRQLFLLTVRGYATDPLGETLTAATKAAVMQIAVEPVWVNKGEPYSGFVEGTSEAVRRNYKWIDRVDVDFTYR